MTEYTFIELIIDNNSFNCFHFHCLHIFAGRLVHYWNRNRHKANQSAKINNSALKESVCSINVKYCLLWNTSCNFLLFVFLFVSHFTEVIKSANAEGFLGKLISLGATVYIMLYNNLFFESINPHLCMNNRDFLDTFTFNDLVFSISQHVFVTLT